MATPSPAIPCNEGGEEDFLCLLRLQFFDLLLVEELGDVEIVHGERPEGGEELGRDVLPHLVRQQLKFYYLWQKRRVTRDFSAGVL